MSRSERLFACSLVAPFEEFGLHFAGQTGRQSDEAAAVSAQQIVVDSGLIVKPFGVGRRHDLDEILVAFPVLDEQHQVSLILVVSGFFIEARPRRRVDFAADDGFNAGFLRS